MIDQIHAVSRPAVVSSKPGKSLRQVLIMRQMKIPSMPDMLQQKRMPSMHIPKPRI